KSRAFREELLERVRRISAFSHVAILRGVPLLNSGFSIPLLVEGRVYQRDEDLVSGIYNASSGPALEALGIRLVRGRPFEPTDHATAEPVALLNEAAVKRFFPDEDPLGRRIASGIPAALARGDSIPKELTQYTYARVVGIVADTRQFDLSYSPQPEVFYPFDQAMRHPMVQNSFALVARTRGEARSLLGTLRQEIRAVDADLPVDHLQTMDSVVRDTLRGQRFMVILLSAFAAVALILSALGIYTVVAWVVSQRTREMGIRLALGAPPVGVVRLVVTQALRPVALGLGLGMLAALACSRILAQYLSTISALDPGTYLLVATLLLATAAGACWIPARRAARVDPMLALRTE
ncbi:MAG: FtsX-like permease family protein, partial [Verrucomicrobiales bacterium]|nr:FtsX-like permease family protein [Verrucomicrobiales bacterium]